MIMFYYFRRSPQGIGPSWTNYRPISKRSHKGKKFRPVFDSCDVCKEKFGITCQTAYRCVECKIVYHLDCRKLGMPCIPIVIPPKNDQKRLRSYCIKSHPMIPPIMIYCILTLEKHQDREEIF